MNNSIENPRPRELSEQEKKNLVKELLLEDHRLHIDQQSGEALERLVANIVEQSVAGLAAGESTAVILGKVRQHPTSFDYLLRDVDDESIINLIDMAKLLWVAPDEILRP